MVVLTGSNDYVVLQGTSPIAQGRDGFGALLATNPAKWWGQHDPALVIMEDRCIQRPYGELQDMVCGSSSVVSQIAETTCMFSKWHY